MAKDKRNIKNLIIDTKFQAKYTALVVLVSVLIFVVLGWLYMAEWDAGTRIMEEINPIVQKGAAPSASAALDGEAAAELAELEALAEGLPVGATEADNLAALEQETATIIKTRGRNHLVWLVGSVGLLVVLLAGLSIWLSHKAAGPVYAVRLFIRAARLGQWSRIRPLRKGDEFAYLATEFLELVADIKKRHADELRGLDEAAELLEAGDAAAAHKIVDRLRGEKTAYLGETTRDPA